MNVIEHLTLEPESAERLARLCGPLDAHLRQIEKDFTVEIRNRGHRFFVEGPAADAAMAAQTLRKLYARTDEAGGIQPEDVHITARDSLPPAQDALSIRTRRGLVRPRNAHQRAYLQGIEDADLSFGIGPAGTGKTYLAVAAAVRALEKEAVRRLILVRPAVEAGERLGFLPGDLSQKVDPYLRPLYDALYEMLGFERVGRLLEKQIIEIAPLAYMRGRTLNESFVILDEAQNATVEQMKMFLTRLGFGSTAVVTGDTTQIDLPKSERSGLAHAATILDAVDGVHITRFSAEDVVRHPLVARIVRAYEADGRA
nr:PhoH family protein [Oceanococcus sp. HetDA_MAG_MS8]